MKLRQILRRPAGNCESLIGTEQVWDEKHDLPVLVITTTCSHLKKPRVQRVIALGDDVAYRERAWQDAVDEAKRERDTHQKYSDPW